MNDHPPVFIHEQPDGVRLDVIVAPRSSRNAVVGTYRQRLKIALTAPPVEGKANEALISFLAELFGIPKRNISVLSGIIARQKTLLIKGVGFATVVKLCEASP